MGLHKIIYNIIEGGTKGVSKRRSEDVKKECKTKKNYIIQ